MWQSRGRAGPRAPPFCGVLRCRRGSGGDDAWPRPWLGVGGASVSAPCSPVAGFPGPELGPPLPAGHRVTPPPRAGGGTRGLGVTSSPASPAQGPRGPTDVLASSRVWVTWGQLSTSRSSTTKRVVWGGGEGGRGPAAGGSGAAPCTSLARGRAAPAPCLRGRCPSRSAPCVPRS